MAAEGATASAPGCPVRGPGLRLPGVRGPDELVRQLRGELAVPGGTRRLVAAHTDLPPVDRWTNGPVEARLPPELPTRGLRGWPDESLLALGAAVDAIPGADGPASADAGAASAAVLWASSTAGLAEYATICTDAALLDPGLTSPVLAPLSAYNGPASTVSIRLGLTGPIETVIGGVTAGLSAVLEAVRMLSTGAATHALVGGSASASRWSVPDQPAGPVGAAGWADGDDRRHPSGPVPATGAACLALGPVPTGRITGAEDGTGVETGRVELRGVRRFGLGDPAEVLDRLEWLDRNARSDGLDRSDRLDRAVSPGGQPEVTVLSTADPTLAGVLRTAGFPTYHLEERLGDFGAAGGLLAVAAAVAYCRMATGPATVRALAVEPGTAAVVRVVRR